jgi:hypothetical protein
VDEDLTLSDCEKPRYLLPEGCKDLNDVIRLQERAAAAAKAPDKHVSMPMEYVISTLAELSGALEKHASAPSNELPLCVTIPDPVTVGDLAGLLHLKPYKLISALIEFNVFASLKSEVTFETASMVCAHLGVAVKKADEA